MTITNTRTVATETLTRTTFDVDGVAHELVTHKTSKGRVEVYVEYADGCGLTQFRGYYDELCVTDRTLSGRVHPMLAAHNQAHADFWRAYLPGAETWLQAA